MKIVIIFILATALLIEGVSLGLSLLNYPSDFFVILGVILSTISLLGYGMFMKYYFINKFLKG